MTNCVFVILRSVQSEYFNNYWLECYKSLRKYYPDTDIKIVDNASNPEFLKCPFELERCEVIAAEFPQTRLYSPFYECLKLSGYDVAVIIHDGIIFNSHVDFTSVETAKFLWHFETHEYDNHALERRMIETMNRSSQLMQVYNSNAWYGCMGCLTAMNLNFLQKLQEKYTITNLIPLVNNQTDAIAFERVLAVLCYTEHPELATDPSFEGDIRNMDWGYTWDDYIQNPRKQEDKPFFKLFGARR